VIFSKQPNRIEINKSCVDQQDFIDPTQRFLNYFHFFYMNIVVCLLKREKVLEKERKNAESVSRADTWQTNQRLKRLFYCLSLLTIPHLQIFFSNIHVQQLGNIIAQRKVQTI
jgi:hypothetical protein